MEIGTIPSVNRPLYTDNNPALRPISKYENNFNKSGVSPLGTWASQHKNLIKTSEQPKNIHQGR